MDYILAPPTVKVSFAVEPAMNVFESLSLLSSTEELSGLNEWVEQTVKTLSPEQRRVNDMIFSISGCLRPNTTLSLPDFPAYIRSLETEDPASFLHRGFEWLFKEPLPDESLPDMEGLLSDVDLFIQYIERWHRIKKAEKGYVLNPQPFRNVHPYLQKPEAFKALTINHMKTMWESVLKPEWERKLPILQESVDAFTAMDYHDMTAVEAIRAVTGRDVSYLDWKWGENMIFVPSPHMGPYITPFTSDDEKTMWLMFTVRMPQGVRGRTTDLSRSELNMRLSALADDTRLRILELVSERGELCAQDIITLLDLSQSAASRNLRQLTATGYLIERRRETAKCYTLNHDRVDDTLKAVRRFLRKHK
jgi:DNA-binding transcriptional ArsR family regulator